MFITYACSLFILFQIHNIGTKFMYISGIGVAGAASVLMGVLEYSPEHSFVSMCYLVRIMQGLGASAVVTGNNCFVTRA